MVGKVSAAGVGGRRWDVATVVVVVMMMELAVLCCEGVAGWLAGSGERARLDFACGTRRSVPRKARRCVAAAGPG